MLIAVAASSCRAELAPAFAQLLGEALSQAPTLLEQRANVDAAAADALQARAWPNPRVEALAENLAAPATGGVSQRQTTYAITQPIEIGGKRGARIEFGERNLAAALARDRQVRVGFAAELAVVYAVAEAALARRSLAGEERERATDDLRAVRALVDAGREAELRLAQARASLAAAQAAEQTASAETVQALERLSAMTGATAPYSGVAGSLLASPAGRARPADDGDNPTVAAARAERDALDALVAVEQKRRIPDLGLSAGVRRYGWTDASGYQVGVIASVPLFDRNAGAIAAARQRVSAAEARLAGARMQATAARRSAQAQAAAAEQRLLAAGEGEQAAAEAYRLGRIGYEAGRTSLIELLTTRRALLEARSLTIDARLARVRAIAALAAADGRLAFSGD